MLCAWTHQKLVESNGRTARLLMNLIRMWVGEKPLLFDNDRNYTLAARTLDAQVFATYLKNLKSQQIEMDPFIDQSLKVLFQKTVTEQKCDQLMLKVLATPFTHLVKRS